MGVTLTYPVVLANGTLEDATQVMANFNAVQTVLANNVAASGVNNDITSLTALSTPIPAAAGGSRTFISSAASTGSANAQVIATTQPTGFARAAGNIVIFNPGFTTTGALQVNVNGQGLANVFRQTQSGLVALVGGEVVVGQYAILIDDGTQFELINPVPTGFGSQTSLASAATTDLGTIDSHNVLITGTTGITSFGSSANLASPLYVLQFAAAVLLTNSASLALPGGINYTTGANDFAIAEFLGSGNWRVLNITPASLPVGGGKILIASGTLSGTSLNIPIPSDAQEIDIEIINPIATAGSTTLSLQYKVGGVTVAAGYAQGTIVVVTSTVSASSSNGSSWGMAGGLFITTSGTQNISVHVNGIQAGNSKGFAAIDMLFGAGAAWAQVNGGNSNNTGLVSDLLITSNNALTSGSYRVYKIK
jgi:hypothetical protein